MEDQRHEQMKKLLDAARHCLNDNPGVVTLAQLAARQGVSVEELRDDARKWSDTAPRMERLITKLKARLQTLVLVKDAGISRAAVHLLGIKLREGQLSSTNRVVAEGSGASIHIVNFADCAKAPAE